jgi:hypothetical protein
VQPGRIAVQVQQPPGLVVGQLDALLAVDQEQPLTHGMQHGLVVLHHPRQGGRRQPVRLTADPTAERPAAQSAHGQGGRARADDAGHRRRQVLADGVDRETRRHQRHDLSAGVQDRTGRPHRRTQGAGVGLGERLPRESGCDRAAERPSDLARVRVGVPGPVRGEDRDERRAGVGPDLLDVGLQHGRRVVAGDGVEHQRGIREARDDRRGLLLGGLPNGLLRLPVGDDRRGQDDGADHEPLQREQPHGQARFTAAARRLCGHGHARSLPRPATAAAPLSCTQ